MSGQIMSLVGAALAAAVLALVLKKDSPALALLIALAGVLVLLYGMLEPAGQLVRAAKSLLSALDDAQTIYFPCSKRWASRQRCGLQARCVRMPDRPHWQRSWNWPERRQPSWSACRF